MRGFTQAIFLVFVLLMAGTAQAQLTFVRNARTYETIQSSLISKGVAHACLNLTLIPDSLPCNPAFTPLTKKPKLAVQALLSNGYPTLDKMRKLLANDVNQDLINALFGSERVLQVEGNTELNFLSKYVNAKYTPMSVRYFSVIRNEANPDIELSAMEESNFVLQSGAQIIGGLYAGLQMRSVNRKFIHKRFKLIDLSVPGNEVLKPKKQSATYFEPSISYFWGTSWKIRTTAMAINIGEATENYSELPMPMEVQGGIAISPPMRWGELEVSLEHRSLNYQEEPLEKLRLGSVYKFGAMYLNGGIDYDGLSAGVFYGLEQINAGVMYSTTQVWWKSDDYYAQTVYLQIGWQI